MRAALEGLKGAKKAQVSFAEKTAIVTYESQTVGVPAMIQAVSKAGFSARVSAAK